MIVTEVRWRRYERRTWRYGHLHHTQHHTDTGAVEIVDHHTGGVRVVPSQQVQRRTSGPRGGQHWVPLEATS